MTQSNKYAARKPFTPKPVVYAAWGLLAAALVARFVPALETVALVLYAVGLIALCLLALTAPKKGTLAVPRVFLPMLAAAFLILGCTFGMRPDESPLVWRSILLALILLIPLVYLLPLGLLLAVCLAAQSLGGVWMAVLGAAAFAVGLIPALLWNRHLRRRPMEYRITGRVD